MNYEEFIDEIKRRLNADIGCPMDEMRHYKKGYAPQDEEEREWISKINEKYLNTSQETLGLDVLTIQIPGEGSFKMWMKVDTERLYEVYKEKGFEKTYEELRQFDRDVKSSNFDKERLATRGRGNYDEIKEHLILRPLNYKLHIRDLSGHVYRRFSDFVLVLYQVLGHANNSLVTSKIKRSELSEWGVGDEEERVINEALLNTMRLYPACVYDYKKGKEVDVLKDEFKKEDIGMGEHILLSTFSTVNGAVSLFYPGVVEKMMSVMGGPFNAVFMNINDVIIFDLKDPIAGGYVDQAKVSSDLGETLSGKLYMCDENGIHPASQYMFKL